MRRFGVLGGGISGVSLAAHLTEDLDILEKRPRVGGLCSSIIEQGFTFDAAGPHIMFSKNKEVLAAMVAQLGDNVHQKRRENRIWFKGNLVKYPFENDLASLPKEDNFDCIYGYLKNPRADEIPTNLEQWSYVTFGKGISEKYFVPYNRKIWNYDPSQIGLEFVSRIPKPPLEDVLKSSIGISTEGYVHQLYFYYPMRGGYESLVKAYARAVAGSIVTEWPVARVERLTDHWRVTNDKGERREYRTLISTMPVHELLAVWPEAPLAARESAARLRYNSLINVLLGFREDRGDPYTAIYVPDPDVLFHRLSFPKAFSEYSVPAGCSAIMAEITTNEGDGTWELADDRIVSRVLSELGAMDLVDVRTICYTRVIRIRYGYPVYDLEYQKNVTALRQSIVATGLRLLGRFAQFDYINSDVCIERSMALAAEFRNG